MLDRDDRRPGMAPGSYWSAVINPALMSFNDFQNYFIYQRSLAAMHQFHQHELLRHHFNACYGDKKRPAQRSETESPKPKRPRTSEASNSGKSKQPQRPTAASAAENPEDLRSETMTPNSNRSGLITFRPHSDILTSCYETGGCGFKAQLHRKKSDSCDLKKIHTVSSATSSTSSKTDLSHLSTDADAADDVEGPISRLFPEILSMVFENLDLQSKGRAAQVLLFDLLFKNLEKNWSSSWQKKILHRDNFVCELRKR